MRCKMFSYKLLKPTLYRTYFKFRFPKKSYEWGIKNLQVVSDPQLCPQNKIIKICK